MSTEMPACSDLDAAGFDAAAAARTMWDALVAAGTFVEGDFTFASGQRATLKVDAEQLASHRAELGAVLGLFATFPCVQGADVLLYVPNGMRYFAHLLAERLNVAVADVVRAPGAQSRYEFAFATPDDQERALSAVAPVILEDVVTTGGSIHGVAELFPEGRHLHSLAMLQRGEIESHYLARATFHRLVRRQISTDAAEFRRLLGTASDVSK